MQNVPYTATEVGDKFVFQTFLLAYTGVNSATQQSKRQRSIGTKLIIKKRTNY